jgi:hypothetical protein
MVTSLRISVATLHLCGLATSSDLGHVQPGRYRSLVAPSRRRVLPVRLASPSPRREDVRPALGPSLDVHAPAALWRRQTLWSPRGNRAVRNCESVRCERGWNRDGHTVLHQDQPRKRSRARVDAKLGECDGREDANRDDGARRCGGWRLNDPFRRQARPGVPRVDGVVLTGRIVLDKDVPDAA